MSGLKWCMSHTADQPYPLVFEPILKAKVWGGRRLEQLGKALPASDAYGESWELADLASTSASGGGGEPAHSVIANGLFAGKTIRDAVEQWGDVLVGDVKLTPSGGFPLLVKYLDAREHLSIQVHPSAEFAAAHEDAFLKTESWIVLQAEPDADGNPAMIYKGFREGTTKDDLAEAIAQGTVPALMRKEPAVVGQCHTLVSGVVHALGAGVLVAEIQTPSDTTFRVYDWAKEYGREGRELHVEQAIECARFVPPEPVVDAPGFLKEDAAAMSGGMPMGMGSKCQRVGETEFYTIDAISASCSAVPLVDDGLNNCPVVVMIVKTMGASIVSESQAYEEVVLEAGQTALIPAACVKDSILRAGPGTEAIVARVV